MSSRPAVLLVGLGPTALSAFRALTAHFQLVGVVRPVDEGAHTDGDTDPVAELAETQEVSLISDASIDGLGRALAATRPDLVVVSSYHRILPASVLAGRPWINVHYAPLPRYRGRAVVNWALINGESSVFVTVHSIVPGLDAGGILAQEAVPVPPRASVGELYERLNAVQERLLPDAVWRRLRGDEGDPQDESVATYCCTRLPDDGEIDWNEPTDRIDRLIRALGSPYPGAFTWLGLEQLVVHDAEPVSGVQWAGRVPGRVVRTDAQAGTVDVLTGDGVLRIHTVSFGTSAPIPAASVIRSVKATLGLRSIDLVRALRAASAAPMSEHTPREHFR
jgi:methionyl-tRNA formyltransferase